VLRERSAGGIRALLELARGDQQVHDHVLPVSGAAHGAVIRDEHAGSVGGGEGRAHLA
jgi:hypothetical protein